MKHAENILECSWNFEIHSRSTLQFLKTRLYTLIDSTGRRKYQQYSPNTNLISFGKSKSTSWNNIIHEYNKTRLARQTSYYTYPGNNNAQQQHLKIIITFN